MLVKKSIVEKWYQRDSWVYKNFSYLFQNPLWNKKIPKGFSVCPYFWLSLFSIFVVRPLIVAPIVYIILPIINIFGPRLNKLDSFLYIKFFKTRSNNYIQGLGICLSLLCSIVAFSIIALSTFIGINTYKFYLEISDFKEGLFVFWSSVSFILLFITIIIHKALTNTECKTMYYLAVWSVLFFISTFIFVPTEFFSSN